MNGLFVAIYLIVGLIGFGYLGHVIEKRMIAETIDITDSTTKDSPEIKECIKDMNSGTKNVIRLVPAGRMLLLVALEILAWPVYIPILLYDVDKNPEKYRIGYGLKNRY